MLCVANKKALAKFLCGPLVNFFINCLQIKLFSYFLSTLVVDRFRNLILITGSNHLTLNVSTLQIFSRILWPIICRNFDWLFSIKAFYAPRFCVLERLKHLFFYIWCPFEGKTLSVGKVMVPGGCWLLCHCVWWVPAALSTFYGRKVIKKIIRVCYKGRNKARGITTPAKPSGNQPTDAAAHPVALNVHSAPRPKCQKLHSARQLARLIFGAERGIALFWEASGKHKRSTTCISKTREWTRRSSSHTQSILRPTTLRRWIKLLKIRLALRADFNNFAPIFGLRYIIFLV